jgi:RNA polymerase sigma-70 factor (ECF subfamily)
MNAVDATQFETYRPLLFSIAYRMLGSATDAEDIVQEAYLRYQATAPSQIVSPKAFLSTIVTRLCLNQLRSAKAQRETYLGPWLPEPVLTGTDEPFAPTQQVELHETLSLAFLVLLEQLTPLERAVFLLRDVFDYDYKEIAPIIGKTEAACRQLSRRAKQHIAAHRPRFKPTPDAHHQIFTQFLRAAKSGDLDGLLQLLADDVTLWADSGGKVRGIKRPLRGREVVARFLLASPQIPSESYQPDIAIVNGEPAMILRADSEARVVVSISIDQGLIYAIWVIGNPDKLKWVNTPPHNSEEAAL